MNSWLNSVSDNNIDNKICRLHYYSCFFCIYSPVYSVCVSTSSLDSKWNTRQLTNWLGLFNWSTTDLASLSFFTLFFVAVTFIWHLASAEKHKATVQIESIEKTKSTWWSESTKQKKFHRCATVDGKEIAMSEESVQPGPFGRVQMVQSRTFISRDAQRFRRQTILFFEEHFTDDR